MPIIKISGAKGSGKTTALNALAIYFNAHTGNIVEKFDLSICTSAGIINVVAETFKAYSKLGFDGQPVPVSVFLDDGGVRPSTAGFLAQELAQRFPSAFIYYSAEGE
jgi:energy-coupling factor transporter ATP-binding protein EcfA2